MPKFLTVNFHRVYKNRDAKLEQSKKWRQDNPERYLFLSARARAKRKGLEFTLDVKDVVIPEVCPVLGINMESPSLDRKDNSKGYTKDNTRVISNRANSLKKDATLEELQLLCKYMESE